MEWFKSKYEKELDEIVNRLKLNMSNNYKDAAQEDFKAFEAAFEEYKAQGKLKGKAIARYSSAMDGFRIKLVGFTHKDQKPYWTSK